MGSLLAGGLLVAACSSGSSGTATTAASASSSGSSSTATTGAPASSSTPTTVKSGRGSSSGLDSLVNGVSKSSDETFSATYLTAQASTGKSQTVTFAQSPPKSAVITPSGSFYIDATSITECQGSGSSATCTTLPPKMSSLVSGLTRLFNPETIGSDLKGLKAQVAAHSAGYVIRTSSATYGGMASNCVTAKGISEPTPVTYCGSTSNGVLTYVNAGGYTVTLTSYSANPPPSTFAPPAGATIQTVPGGA